jgi:hypothetical protein
MKHKIMCFGLATSMANVQCTSWAAFLNMLTGTDMMLARAKGFCNSHPVITLLTSSSHEHCGDVPQHQMANTSNGANRVRSISGIGHLAYSGTGSCRVPCYFSVRRFAYTPSGNKLHLNTVAIYHNFKWPIFQVPTVSKPHSH